MKLNKKQIEMLIQLPDWAISVKEDIDRFLCMISFK